MKYIKVPVGQLIDYLAAYYESEALNCGGVDNWSWYGENFDEMKRIFYKDITGTEATDEDIEDISFEELAELKINTMEVIEDA